MSRRKVGVFVALSAEARALTGAPAPVRTPFPLNDDVLLWIGGVGSRAAGTGCRALVDAGAGALVSFGTAAGLAPDCVAGTLVVPDRVLCPDTGPLVVDADWRQVLSAALKSELPVIGGDAANAAAVLAPEQKQALFRQTGAVSADMESAAVGVASVQLGVPLVVVRSVSDGPLDALPAGLTGAVDVFGRPKYGRILALVTKRPAEFGNILRVAAGFRAACRTLRRVVRCAGMRFRCPD